MAVKIRYPPLQVKQNIGPSILKKITLIFILSVFTLAACTPSKKNSLASETKAAPKPSRVDSLLETPGEVFSCESSSTANLNNLPEETCEYLQKLKKERNNALASAYLNPYPLSKSFILEVLVSKGFWSNDASPQLLKNLDLGLIRYLLAQNLETLSALVDDLAKKQNSRNPRYLPGGLESWIGDTEKELRQDFIYAAELDRKSKVQQPEAVSSNSNSNNTTIGLPSCKTAIVLSTAETVTKPFSTMGSIYQSKIQKAVDSGQDVEKERKYASERVDDFLTKTEMKSVFFVYIVKLSELAFPGIMK
jgi:hypothetical protein